MKKESLNLTIKDEPILESDPEMDGQQEQQVLEDPLFETVKLELQETEINDDREWPLLKESIEVIVKEEPVFESITVPTMKEEDSLVEDELDILPVKVESNNELTDDEYILGLGVEETEKFTLASRMNIDQGVCHTAKASGSSLSIARVECRNVGANQNDSKILPLKVKSNVKSTSEEYILGLGDTRNKNMTLPSSEKNADQVIDAHGPLSIQQHCTNQCTSAVPTEQNQHSQSTRVEEYDGGNVLEYEQKMGKCIKQCKPKYDNSGDCSKSLNQNMNDETHFKMHNDNNYKCIECGKCFTKKCNLKSHFRMHTAEKIYKCDECGKCFAQRGNLEAHVRIHTGEKNYKCEECGKCYSRNSDLKMHIRIHTGAKDYKCEVCGMCFYKCSSLRVHSRIHSGERNYKCKECGKCFIQRGHLESHLRIHTGEKNYKCEECGKCFKQRTHLRTHLLIHSGEKKHKCEECGKSFTQKCNLKKHYSNHPDKNMP